MGKFLGLFVLVALIVFFIGVIVPFWGLMILVVLAAFLVNPSTGKSFFASGFSFGLVWLSLSIWITYSTGSDLSLKMAELMGLSNDNLLWFATGLIGFIIGGFSGWTGSLFRRVLEKRDKGIYKSQF